jgi:hypothetical protein
VLVTKESNSTQNGKNIFTAKTRRTQGRQNKRDFCEI